MAPIVKKGNLLRVKSGWRIIDFSKLMSRKTPAWGLGEKVREGNDKNINSFLMREKDRAWFAGGLVANIVQKVHHRGQSSSKGSEKTILTCHDDARY